MSVERRPLSANSERNTRRMRKLLFIIAFVFAACGITRAQDFDYTVTTDSVIWNGLSSQTILNTGNTAWNFRYKIPIGFTFNFCGRDFDSLAIEYNGCISFDPDRYYVFMAFNAFGCYLDSNSNYSVLGYDLSGTTGNHILKIQYKNVGLTGWTNQLISYQLWLYENGAIECRCGPGNLDLPHPGFAGIAIGMFNSNFDTEPRGYFFNGIGADPGGVYISETNPDLPALDYLPVSGELFRFEPIP